MMVPMHDQSKTDGQLVEQLQETRRLLASSEEVCARLRREAAAFDLAGRQLRAIFDSVDESIYVADTESHELLYVNEAFRRRWGDGVGQLCHRVLHGARAPCEFCTNDKILGDNLGRPYVWECQNRLIGRWFRCIDKAVQWPDGRIVRYELAIDITERKQYEESLGAVREELEERVALRTAELAAANSALTVEVAERKAAEESLRDSEETARALINAPSDVAILLKPDGTILTLNETAGRRLGIRVEDAPGVNAYSLLEPEIAESRRIRNERVLATGKAERFEDTRNGRRFDHTVYPVFDTKGTVARFAIFSRDVTEAKEAEAELRGKQRLLRQLLDLHERERRLVAYEIHDGLAQELTGALLRLQAFREILKRNPEDAWRVFDVGLNLLGQSVKEARALITGLRPPVLDESGIIAAIDYLVCENEERGGPRIEFHHDIQHDRLDPSIEIAIFRIVQETLTNARRHSQSDTVRVELRGQDNLIRMEVQDWGIGFDPARTAENQFGLEGVRERARLLGGHATIDSAPGEGTHVVVELPVRDAS
jgi:PAS domain S-box-containing protein